MPTLIGIDDTGTVANTVTPEQILPRSFSPLPPPSNSTCPTTGLYYFSCKCGNHRCGYCGRRQRDQRRSEGMCQCRLSLTRTLLSLATGK